MYVLDGLSLRNHIENGSSQSLVDTLEHRVDIRVMKIFFLDFVHEYPHSNDLKYVSTDCCFVKYANIEDASRALIALHNQYTFPGVSSTMLAIKVGNYLWF